MGLKGPSKSIRAFGMAPMVKVVSIACHSSRACRLPASLTSLTLLSVLMSIFLAFVCNDGPLFSSSFESQRLLMILVAMIK
jgi:hypothetical protein